MTNIAIFVSGNGTNCENIIRHFDGSSDVRVVIVLSNRADAYALVRAASLGVRTAIMDKTAFRNKESLTELMERHNVDFIVLAGFLLMIPPFLIARYPHRIVNIHPALLPKYGGKGMYGRHIHEAVKSAGETETGITIHYVSEVCDGGEIIFQARTAVTPEDTLEDIAAKVGRLEQEHYPKVIGNVVRQLV